MFLRRICSARCLASSARGPLKEAILRAQAMAAGQFHKHRVGAWLRYGMVTAALADKVELAALGHQIQQGLRHQGVVDEGIALPQQPVGLEGE
jgi:hypothetical protein